MKRTRLLPFLLGALVSAAIYALYFGHAFFVDEGSYCTLAQGILNGQLPYRDYFNEKGPLHYFLTAFVMSLSLPGIAGGRITSSVLLALTLGLLFRPLLTAGCDRATRHAWFAAVVLSALGMSVLNNTGEATLAFAVALSATQLLLPGPPTRSRIWIIGLAHGLASGARLTMLLPAFILLFIPMGNTRRRDYLLALGTGVALWVLPLIALGIWDDFLFAGVYFHLGNPKVASYLGYFARPDLPLMGVWALTLLLAFALAYRRKEYRYYVLWTIALALPFFVRMDVFRLWPSLVTLLLFLLARLRSSATDTEPQTSCHAFPDAWPTPRRRMGAILTMPLLIAFLASVGLVVQDRWKDYDALQRVADRVRTLVKPDQAIWAVPFTPGIYCLADRPSATRFYFILPWLAKPEVQRETIATLERHPPVLIVDESHADGVMEALLPGYDDFLKRRYTLLETLDDTRLYARRP